ncbi:MAG: polysaccharide biosynthesis C-terminal domain-containing protein [Eisenbergiella massiliensis]
MPCLQPPFCHHGRYPDAGLFKTGNLELPAALLRIRHRHHIPGPFHGHGRHTQGLERERNVLINSAIAFLVHIITLYILLKSTKLGITAVLISTIVLYALLFILNLLSVQRRISLRIDWGRMIGTLSSPQPYQA